jgi:ceramide glucosyltransferase
MMLQPAYLALVALATVWTLTGLVALLRARRRTVATDRDLAPVSVLKPLCGEDAELRANLRTFFEQDHPRFELVFGVQGNDDPAARIVRELRAEFPEVACKLVVHDGGRGLNPKVSNLRAMMMAVSHELVVISDSNVRVRPHYLRELATIARDPRVGVVTNAIAGVGERTLGATLEASSLNGEVAIGAALPTELLDHPIVIGKSMLFRRSVFERLGGFESVANLLAEDYVIGRMFHEAGYRVALAPTPIENVCGTTTVSGFFQRHQRWGMLRIRLQPFAWMLEPLSRPIAVAVLAPLFGVPIGPALVWAVALTIARDAIAWIALRGPRGLFRALPLFVVRDAILLASFATVPFMRHVRWRGKRVRVSAGTRLYAEHTPEGPRALRVEA